MDTTKTDTTNFIKKNRRRRRCTALRFVTGPSLLYVASTTLLLTEQFLSNVPKNRFCNGLNINTVHDLVLEDIEKNGNNIQDRRRRLRRIKSNNINNNRRLSFIENYYSMNHEPIDDESYTSENIIIKQRSSITPTAKSRILQQGNNDEEMMTKCQANMNGFYGQPNGRFYESVFIYQTTVVTGTPFTEIITTISPALNIEIVNLAIPFLFPQCNTTTATSSSSNNNDDTITTAVAQRTIRNNKERYTLRHRNQQMSPETVPQPSTITAISSLPTDQFIMTGLPCTGIISDEDCYVVQGYITFLFNGSLTTQQISSIVNPIIQYAVQTVGILGTIPNVISTQYMMNITTVAPPITSPPVQSPSSTFAPIINPPPLIPTTSPIIIPSPVVPSPTLPIKPVTLSPTIPSTATEIIPSAVPATKSPITATILPTAKPSSTKFYPTNIFVPSFTRQPTITVPNPNSSPLSFAPINVIPAPSIPNYFQPTTAPVPSQPSSIPTKGSVTNVPSVENVPSSARPTTSPYYDEVNRQVQNGLDWWQSLLVALGGVFIVVLIYILYKLFPFGLRVHQSGRINNIKIQDHTTKSRPHPANDAYEPPPSTLLTTPVDDEGGTTILGIVPTGDAIYKPPTTMTSTQLSPFNKSGKLTVVSSTMDTEFDEDDNPDQSQRSGSGFVLEEVPEIEDYTEDHEDNDDELEYVDETYNDEEDDDDDVEYTERDDEKDEESESELFEQEEIYYEEDEEEVYNVDEKQTSWVQQNRSFS